MQPVLQDSFPQLTHDGLLRFEAEHRIELPADYRQWLIRHNGGTYGGRAMAISPDGTFHVQRMYGIDTGFEYGEGRPTFRHPAQQSGEDSVPAKVQQPSPNNPLLVPFAREVDGDELAFSFVSQREMGPIVRVVWPRPESDPVPQAWWSFSEFLAAIGPDPHFHSRWDDGPEHFRMVVHGDAEEIETRLPDFSPNEMDAQGDTLLTAAVSTGRPDVGALLLANGANPSISNHRGESPLHAAAAAGSLDGTRLLLDAGARIDATDSDGNTPVVRATQAGHIRVALLLIERGANTRLRNRKGRAVADYCDDPVRVRHILPRVAA
jgi:hypothetical protein